jgi:hypothetical protein
VPEFLWGALGDGSLRCGEELKSSFEVVAEARVS